MATVKELGELTKEELQARASELKQTLFELKNKASTGVLDSTAELMKTRREVARCLTVARAKDLEAMASTANKASKAKE
jgi:large subunit ribosomal protein L29